MSECFTNTGVMCMITIDDLSRKDGFKSIDLGNYFLSPSGSRCLILTSEDAKRYGHLASVPVYVMKKDSMLNHA